MKPTALLLLMMTLLATPLRAEEPDLTTLEPNLDESKVLFERMAATMIIEAEESGKPGLAGEPPWGHIDPLQLAPLRRVSRVRTVEGLKKFDIENPPHDTLWWNYPIYATIGLPRDLIDGFFGGVSYVPFFNMFFTGGYELSGAQILMRHRHDRHVWPGRPNTNGHGWIKAPEGWGFFPHKNQTIFRVVDETQLESWKIYNDSVDAKLTAANEAIDQHNMQALELRTKYMEETLRHYESNNFSVVVERLRHYTQVDTSNRQARAMLAVSLIALLPETPYRRWTHEQLGNILSAASASALSRIDTGLREIRKRNIAPRETTFYLTWVNMRMGYPDRAYKEIAEVLKNNPQGQLRAQLIFESALAAREQAGAESAIQALAKTTTKDSPILLHAKGRYAYAFKDYDGAIAIYRELTREAPTNARYHYLLGLSQVAKGQHTQLFDRAAALKALSRAVRYAPSQPERIQYEKSLRAAKQLNIHPPEPKRH